MNILSFLNKKKEKKDYFLTLLLKPFKVSSILFEQLNGQLSILAVKEEKLSLEISKIDRKSVV